MAKYHKPELEFFDIVAHSGYGTYTIYSPDGNLLHPLGVPEGIVNVCGNLGLYYRVGVGKGCYDSSNAQSLVDDNALSVRYFNNADEAIDYLREVVALGRPVVVTLEHYYIYDDFTKASDWWKTQRRPERYHNTFFTVTGYDEEYFYVNSPIDYSATIDGE